LCLSFAPLPLYIPSFYSGVVVSFALFMENKMMLQKTPSFSIKQKTGVFSVCN
jgi:hypothetical protein